MHYQYDKIGNLIQDVANGISYIAWTSFGKISKITNNQGDINFAYDALGRRIKKENKSTGIITYTTYDASGNIMGIYEVKPDLNDNSALYISQLPIYGSSRIGVIHSDTKLSYINGNTYTICSNLVPENPNKVFTLKYLYCNREFELTNHLGNVQVTISDKRIRIPNPNNNQLTAYYLPVVLTTTDYYPFGMQMPSRTFTATTGVTYKFGFNGKEKDDEVTGSNGVTYDYGFRIYDERIARFLSVDPLFYSYPWYSPKQFAGNNPIRYMDLDGLENVTPEIRYGYNSSYQMEKTPVYTRRQAQYSYQPPQLKTITNEKIELIRAKNSPTNFDPQYNNIKGELLYEIGNALSNAMDIIKKYKSVSLEKTSVDYGYASEKCGFKDYENFNLKFDNIEEEKCFQKEQKAWENSFKLEMDN